MDFIDRIKKFVRSKNPAIYEHAESTMEMAKELALKWDIDIEKVCIAALLHDALKNLVESKDKIKEYNVRLDRLEKRLPCLWHGAAAEVVARREFKIKDKEILNAIRWHSTSNTNIGMVGKILYVSDYVELNRKDVEHIRSMCFEDIKRAFLLVMDEKIANLLKEGKIIHPRLIFARNYFLEEKG